MKNTIYFLLPLFLLGIFACDNSDTDSSSDTISAIPEVIDDGSVTRIWKMKEIDLSGFSEEENPLKYRARKMRSKGYFISLFPDFTGTVIKTKLLATFPNAGKIIFETYSKLAPTPEEDPFHPKNNLWRLRKLDNENSKEITAKADNYLQHVRYLFKARVDNPDRRFSTVNSSGVLNVYNGGIGVVEKSKISEDWFSYFYTKEQALEAWKVVRKRIGKNTLRSKRGDNWVEENYKALVQRLDGE